MSYLIDGQVLAYVCLRGLPHEGPPGWVEFDQQAAVAVWRSEGRVVRN